MMEKICLWRQWLLLLPVSGPLRTLPFPRALLTAGTCLRSLLVLIRVIRLLLWNLSRPSRVPAMKRNKHQLTLIGVTDRTPPPGAIARDFDPARLTQARHLAAMTKKEVADAIHVTAAAVGQYEAGMRPRPDLIPALAATLNVPPAFFLPGR